MRFSRGKKGVQMRGIREMTTVWSLAFLSRSGSTGASLLGQVRDILCRIYGERVI